MNSQQRTIYAEKLAREIIKDYGLDLDSYYDGLDNVITHYAYSKMSDDELYTELEQIIKSYVD